MNFLPRYCPECRNYLGIMDEDAAPLDVPLQFPHAPWCKRMQAEDIARYVEALERADAWQ